MRLGIHLVWLLCGACAAVGAPTGPSRDAAVRAEPELGSPGPDVGNPGPDFGSVPDSAQVVPPGRAYLETALLTGRSDDRTVRTSTVPVLLRVGLREDLELRALLNAVIHEDAPLGDTTSTGPFGLGFKLRIDPGDAGFLHPSYGVEGTLIFPVASGGRDTGKLEPALSLNVDHFVTERGTLTWNVGALAPVDGTGAQHLQGLFTAAYYQRVAEPLQLFVAGETRAPAASAGGGTLAHLGTGFYWYLTRRVVLYSAYNWGLTDPSLNTEATVGLTLAF